MTWAMHASVEASLLLLLDIVFLLVSPLLWFQNGCWTVQTGDTGYALVEFVGNCFVRSYWLEGFGGLSMAAMDRGKWCGRDRLLVIKIGEFFVNHTILDASYLTNMNKECVRKVAMEVFLGEDCDGLNLTALAGGLWRICGGIIDATPLATTSKQQQRGFASYPCNSR